MLLNVLLFLNVGGGELFIIFFFMLLFFGPKNLPEIARGLGKGMREFKDAMNGIQHEIQKEVHEVQRLENLKEIDKILDEEKPAPSKEEAPKPPVNPDSPEQK